MNLDFEFERVASDFSNTADVPKDSDLYYRCIACGTVIPSIPCESCECDCGSVFIDKDHWRLVVIDFEMFDVIRRVE